MMQTHSYDAVVIGAGPNGLAAAIALAQAGYSAIVFEAAATVGGAVRSAELTLPGFKHDLCSAVYPLALGSPFLRTLPLRQHGLEWIHPPAPLAHPLDDGSAVVVERSVPETARQLGVDRMTYQRLLEYFCAQWQGLDVDLLGPPGLPRHPLALACFGMQALWPAVSFARRTFRGARGRALFAGLAAHSMLSLDAFGSTAFGLVLGITAHSVGWPLVAGGAQALADALASYACSLGVEIVTEHRVASLSELPKSRVVLCDVMPSQLAALARSELPSGFRRSLEKYRYGMGVFKMDWALAGPVPWKAAACRRAATVHLGNSLEEIAASEKAASRGQRCDRPFVLAVQPSLFDPTRTPAGQHTLWAYCHVPLGSTMDYSCAVENQIERFAPGFRELIRARSVRSPADLERDNANLIGGDINGGSADLRQLWLRPTARLYKTPKPGLYICSAATPPGGGVHGMCGYFSARAAIRYLRKDRDV